MLADPELEAIAAMLDLNREARARVIAYLEMRDAPAVPEDPRAASALPRPESFTTSEDLLEFMREREWAYKIEDGPWRTGSHYAPGWMGWSIEFLDDCLGCDDVPPGVLPYLQRLRVLLKAEADNG